MDEKAIQKKIEMILLHDSSGFTSQTGAFIKILRDLASLGTLREFSEAASVFSNMYPQNRGFIRANIPAILVNHYFPVLKSFDFEAFITFSCENPDWANAIRESAFVPDQFLLAVKKIEKKARIGE